MGIHVTQHVRRQGDHHVLPPSLEFLFLHPGDKNIEQQCASLLQDV